MILSDRQRYKNRPKGRLLWLIFNLEKLKSQKGQRETDTDLFLHFSVVPLKMSQTKRPLGSSLAVAKRIEFGGTEIEKVVTDDHSAAHVDHFVIEVLVVGFENVFQSAAYPQADFHPAE